MKKRIASAIVLLLIFIPLLFRGGILFALFMSILSVLSLYELLNIRKKTRPFPISLECLAYLLTAFFTMNGFDEGTLLYSLDYRLISLLILVNLIPLVFINDKNKYNLTDALFLIGSSLLVGLTFNLLVLMREYNIDYVIYIFIITTFTDTFAYLTGKYIGKNKLAPNISPNKTIEGAIGGSITASFVGSLYFISVFKSATPLWLSIVITISLTILAQIGDIVFSFIKREFNTKDFSNIIPGHGGILDRLDSMIFVTLGFLIILSII